MIGDLINLSRYPIDRLGSPEGAALLREARAAMAGDGALALPGFATPAAVRAILAEATASNVSGHRMVGEFTPYSDNLSEADDESLPPDHPRRHRLPAAHTFIAGDAFGSESALRRIYLYEPLQEFLRAVLDIPALYPVADPLGCINALVYEPGDSNGWHFDSTDFIVSLSLQPAARGGDYHYIPNLRTPEDENLAAITARMRNPDAPAGVKSAALPPGCLFLFKGKHTLHRVTEIEGSTPRVVSILSYDQRPGHILSDGSKRAMYGRTDVRCDPS